MADVTFSEAIIHARKPHRVCGIKLRPFSLWHAALLDALKSPFAGHPTRFDFAGLLLVARCCTLRYPCSPTAFNGWTNRAVALAKAGRYRRHFIRELNNFSAYIRDYSAAPEFVTSESAEPVKTPWYLFLAVQLPEGGWDTPVGYARWYVAAKAEAAGAKIDLLTDTDRADLAAVAAAGPAKPVTS